MSYLQEITRMYNKSVSEVIREALSLLSAG
ncbi:MAG: hypothetical protein NDI77_14680 [Geobacteraceae bacterium]|nr:hypothetical protein [Geobacteraceae bacterium]